MYQNHRKRGGDHDIANNRTTDPSDDHTIEVPELGKVSDLDGQDGIRNASGYEMGIASCQGPEILRVGDNQRV